MTSPDEIVVFAEPVVKDLGGAWIARLPAIGACGVMVETRAAALDSLYADLRALIRDFRFDGVLEERLRDSGLTWGYVRDFPGVKSRLRG